jgi:hypothetical protein
VVREEKPGLDKAPPAPDDLIVPGAFYFANFQFTNFQFTINDPIFNLSMFENFVIGN